ncbi:hypothetical protein [Pseudodesulfovibrio sediminis]|uniref:Uncharacterized protein n=1 Tax=Pseudodesulfovibrio sediminis TaxID=2810563 RepID=A0ABM7P6Z5_9BACT|nr:hypothetical protein [Pseudodesulfovibrio sediminis]BCS88723.1 hypothetical protein PSDVSF_19650 [Pseudodesulfovibrio sediminis]
MKNETFLTTLILALLILLGLSACKGDDESKRLAALEAEVASLKSEMAARNDEFKAELVRIRKNLEGIESLLKIDKKRTEIKEGEQSGESTSDEELDAKAKSFVNENLDRLMDLTRQMLDSMEKELDEQMDKLNTPTPQQGDEI